MQTIYLDISNKGVIPTIYAKQGDVGRKFRVLFTNAGLKYNIPENAVFSVWYDGASGEGNYTSVGEKNAITTNGNEVIVEIITQMVSNAGVGTLCLVLFSDDGMQIGSWNVEYSVEGVPGLGSVPAEQYYTALTEAASKAAESLVLAKEAVKEGSNIVKEAESVVQQAVEYVENKFLGKAGIVYPLATNNVPEGFLLCDGAEYSRTEYAELFDAIGTVYGEGDGESTFNVPNLSTRVPVGTGDGYDLGATGGNETHTLTIEEMPSHSHKLLPLVEGYPGWQETTLTENTIAHDYDGDSYHTTGQTINVTYVAGGSSAAAGGNQPCDNMQPYTVFNYIISTGKEVEFVVGGKVSAGGSIELDATLTQEGKAADAKAVGDAIGNVESALDGIIKIQNSLIGGEQV